MRRAHTHTGWFIAAVALLLLTFTLVAAAARGAEPTDRAASISAMEERFGVEVRGIRRTAAGHMLDFRYRVVDAVKAAPLFERKTKPSLTVQDSGIHLAVPVPPTVGPLRNSNPPLEGRTYFILFGNPDGYVKSNQLVTVEIGEFRVENLAVGP
jgi:hypothetical protein